MTDPIKATIQELCPDVMEPYACQCSYHSDADAPHTHIIVGSPITLAVVVRALKAINNCFAPLERNSNNVTRLIFFWNKHDNYDQQSEECKQFIGSLLGL